MQGYQEKTCLELKKTLAKIQFCGRIYQKICLNTGGNMFARTFFMEKCNIEEDKIQKNTKRKSLTKK